MNEVQKNVKFSSLNSQLAKLHECIYEEIPQIVRISFAIYDATTDHLKTYADSTPKGEVLVHYEYPLSKIASLKKCAENKIDRYINNLYDRLNTTDRKHNDWLKNQDFYSSLASPIYYNDTFIGFVFINASEGYELNEQKSDTLRPYITRIKEAIINEYQLIDVILKSTESILKKNPQYFQHAKDHQERMYYFSKVIARGVTDIYHLDDEQIGYITLFSRLHDIGKLSLPGDLLSKPGSLATRERKQVMGHIEKGIAIIDQILSGMNIDHHACIATLRDMLSCHHEFLDGSGYPLGLKAHEIPISARIITVANVFDALTSHRPYKQARSVPFALLELEKMVTAGKLDPHCVNTLRYNQDYLKEVIEKYPEPDPSETSDSFYT